jgi:hypothetical protein
MGRSQEGKKSQIRKGKEEESKEGRRNSNV